ncbi:MAG: flagellar assembly protein FliH [Paenisporosarcina sp.]
MTSLSRIIRSEFTNAPSEPTKSIQIRNLSFQSEVSEELPLTLDMLLKERDRYMEKAMEEIELERHLLMNQKQQTQVYIEQERTKWEQDKTEFRQQAYEEGFQQGFEEGHLKAQSDMTHAIQQANETMQHTHDNAKKYIDEQEKVILELSLRTAERIIGTALEENEDYYLSLVKRGLKEAREMKEIKLYVPAVYHALVSSNRDELASIFPVDVPFMIFVNEDLQATDLYIETNHGRIVVSVDEQLNQLRLKLTEILESQE